MQEHAYAPGTLRNLKTHWKLYLSFCSLFRLLPVPVSPETISSYAVFFARSTSLYQTMRNKLNGVRSLHLFRKTLCTAWDSLEVTLTKNGLKRLIGLATHQKSPITPFLLPPVHLGGCSPLVPLHRSLLLISLKVKSEKCEFNQIGEMRV